MDPLTTLYAYEKERLFLDKLRIIQLIEADLNFGLNILSGQPLVQHADAHKINSSQINGSHAGRNTYDALLINQLLSDITWLNHTLFVILFNDVEGY